MSLLFRIFNTTTKKTELRSSLFEQETPSGTIDGTNKDFILATKPQNQKSTIVFLDSRPLPLTEWTLDVENKIISLATAPVHGQYIYVFYLSAE